MNNEPVVWGWYDLEIERFFPHWDEDLMENKEGCIPLYTHPHSEKSVKVKELTDEEIAEVFDNTFKVRDFEDYFLKFARAILRKAQEK